MKNIVKLIIVLCFAFTCISAKAAVSDYRMYLCGQEKVSTGEDGTEERVTFLHATVDAVDDDADITEFDGIAILALYDKDDNLINVIYEDITASAWTIWGVDIPSEEISGCEYMRGFLWKNDGSIEPVCVSEKVGVNKISLSTREEVADEPAVVTMDTGDAEIVEKKYGRYEMGGYAPPAVSWYFENRVEEKIDIQDSSFEIKENGSYVVCVKDADGLKSYNSIYINSIQCPVIELSYEIEDGKAIITVNTVEYNENAPIQKMVWKKYEPFSGGSIVNHFLRSGTEITGNTFEVTESDRYAVAVIDEWGNKSYQTIRVTIPDESADQA